MSTRRTMLVAVLCFAGLASAAWSQTTTSDPAIPKANLERLLRPLTADEIKTEIEGWQALVREKAQAVADAEIAGVDPTELTKLKAERNELTDRMDVAIKAYEAKGGDAAPYIAYVDAVSAETVDLSSVQAAGETVAKFKAWLLSADGGIKWAKNIVVFLLILIAFWILARMAASFVTKAVNRLKHTSELLRKFLVNLTRNAVLLVGLIMAFAMLGIDVTPLIAIAGAATFVLGFALQGTLSNFAAGVMILIYRPYDVGNFVNAAGVTGKVEAMTLVSTTIKTPDNQTIIVPNGSIWGGVITNVTGNDTRRVDLVFGIGYGDDVEKARGILEDLARSHPKTLDDPAPVVKVHELGDSSVNFIVRPWTKTSDYWDVYWDLTAQVKARFDQEGVSIPFPQRDVHLYQEKS